MMAVALRLPVTGPKVERASVLQFPGAEPGFTGNTVVYSQNDKRALHRSASGNQCGAGRICVRVCLCMANTGRSFENLLFYKPLRRLFFDDQFKQIVLTAILNANKTSCFSFGIHLNSKLLGDYFNIYIFTFIKLFQISL